MRRACGVEPRRDHGATTNQDETTMTTTTETTSRNAALAAILATRDAGEDDLREAGILHARGDADAREALEDAARAAGAGLCVMCSHAGICTVTRQTRAVPHDFLGTLWRGTQTDCDACGYGLVTLHICIDCQTHGLDSSASSSGEECPCCGEGRGAQRIRDRADFDAVEAAGREDAETYLTELVDDETGNNRAPTLEDLDGLAPWDDGAISATTTDERLEMAGLPGDLDDKAAGRVWDLIQRDWCAAYNRGANARIEEERAELEAAAQDHPTSVYDSDTDEYLGEASDDLARESAEEQTGTGHVLAAERDGLWHQVPAGGEGRRVYCR